MSEQQETNPFKEAPEGILIYEQKGTVINQIKVERIKTQITISSAAIGFLLLQLNGESIAAEGVIFPSFLMAAIAFFSVTAICGMDELAAFGQYLEKERTSLFADQEEKQKAQEDHVGGLVFFLDKEKKTNKYFLLGLVSVFLAYLWVMGNQLFEEISAGWGSSADPTPQTPSTQVKPTQIDTQKLIKPTKPPEQKPESKPEPKQEQTQPSNKQAQGKNNE